MIGRKPITRADLDVRLRQTGQRIITVAAPKAAALSQGAQAAPPPMEYAMAAGHIYIPAIYMGTICYADGKFLEYGQTYHQAGTGADGVSYYWYRAFQKFSIAPLLGYKLTKCELRWILASKAFAGSGANAQLSMKLHAISDYGVCDRGDWARTTREDYGVVNTYVDKPGILCSMNVMDRVQDLIDGLEEDLGYSSDLCVQGTASASSESGIAYAWKAFDGELDTDWGSTDVPPQWVRYQFSIARTIRQYTITATDNAFDLPNTPKDWLFQGSNNGTDWTTLDSRSNEDGWSASETRTYQFANSTAYLYYRIYVTANNGGDYVWIAEIEMMEYIGMQKQYFAAFRFVSASEPTDVNNANNYRLNELYLYCEF